ncbi:MAG: glycoside hydrolase family 2 protein [Cellulomonas sp.]
MIATNLCGTWTLRAAGGPVPEHIAGRDVPAQVPGTAHTDLLAAGLIADPYVDQGEAELVWAHRADWQYSRELVAAPAGAGERVDLVFEGLDTVATVTLGEAIVGRTFNQHRSYRLDVREQLAAAAGEPVTLGVHFRSALEYAEAEQARLGARPAAYDHPLNMVRKMACSFGWDWGPDLQTAGIWKPVSLERWAVARLSAVRPLVRIEPDGTTARVAVHVDVERSGLEAEESALTVHVRLGAVRATATIDAGTTSAIVDVVVADAALWWPVGYGEQPLHDLDVTLTRGTEPVTPLGTWHRRIGLRTVELDTSADAVGTAFTLRVNGQPVFVRGANWIPDDHLLTRLTRDRLTRRIDQALGANLNLLRVWGGGIYESEDFYTLCDEAGVMVWQDFPLACAAYPEEEPHRSEFEAEAREHVTRLSAHPSLVVWNGGNENIWGWMDWGWQDALAGRTWGWTYYTELFPAIIAELDPTRPYSVGSPCSPGAAPESVHPNDPDHGTHHQWEVWNRTDYTAYRDEIPRFCSEFGFQGPPTWATLTRAVRNPDGAPLSKHDPVFLAHQKAEDGNGKLDRGMAPHLGIPADFADWHWAAQLNQARAVAHAITHYRSWWPRTAGAIVWQLNDCWPVTSWAAVDGDERPKPLWWALRAAFADRILTVQERDGHAVLAVVNDSAMAWLGEVRVRRESLDGALLAEAHLAVDAAARSVELLALPADLRLAGNPADELLVAELGGARTVHTWAPDVDLDLRPEPLVASVEGVDGGYRVTVTATSLALDVTLLVDRLDPAADVDLGLVTLPAGATATFRVTSAVPGLEGALTGPAVLRSANDLTLTRPPVAAAPDRQVASIG